MLALIQEVFDEPEDISRIENATYDNGIKIFSGVYPESIVYDLTECLKKTRELYPDFDYEAFVEYITNGKFYQSDDLIFNLPIFTPEARHYQIKRESEDVKEEITESLYHCNKCKRPVVSQTRQTRASDEGVSVFVHCAHCNISRQV